MNLGARYFLNFLQRFGPNYVGQVKWILAAFFKIGLHVLKHVLQLQRV